MNIFCHKSANAFKLLFRNDRRAAIGLPAQPVEVLNLSVNNNGGKGTLAAARETEQFLLR